MEQPSMMHLLAGMEEPPDGFDLLVAQRELQARIYDSGGYDYRPDLPAETQGELLKSVRFNDEAIDSEREEVRDRLPWKLWKSEHRSRRDSPIEEDVRVELMFEGIDELHFLVNKLISFGFETWDQVEAWYWAKNRENFARQERNY